jgi:hypothetical protein
MIHSQNCPIWVAQIPNLLNSWNARNSEYKVLDIRDVSDDVEPFYHGGMNYFAHWELF